MTKVQVEREIRSFLKEHKKYIMEKREKAKRHHERTHINIEYMLGVPSYIILVDCSQQIKGIRDLLRVNPLVIPILFMGFAETNARRQC